MNRPSGSSLPRPPLRLRSGMVILALQCLVWLVIPLVFPGQAAVALLGGAAGGLAAIIWWLFFSQVLRAERWGAFVLMALALAAASRLVHPSIAGGMMGMMLPIYALPVLGVAVVVSAVAGRHLNPRQRHLFMVSAILLACGIFTLLRTGGLSGDANSDFHWRWTRTPEERLLAQAQAGVDRARGQPKAAAPMPVRFGPKTATWPGFRGAGRDSVIRGTQIETDWKTSPPVELWRKPIGPGWSSFAVNGSLLYTQEQRGDDEVVSCYNPADGEPVWRHHDAARFWESNAGPGPRGTPTLHDGRVYTFGATGLLNALNALDGTVAWSRNAASDTKRPVPDWGFASSPLVVGDVVIVAVSGTLAAYDRATGEPRWSGPPDGGSYSSPHLLEVEGVSQVLLMSGAGATSVAPSDGRVLWQHAWKGFAIVQPAHLGKGDILISTGDRTGARRIEIKRGTDAWTVQERWTTNRLKAYFNDFVVHRGHAFGFDSGILTCVDLEDGARKWKGGRYGSGQLVLLADQDLLLILSEQGGVALVPAAPGEFTELARFRALDGKTWNHPVLVGDILLVRNDQEMAAFRLVATGR